MRIKFIFLIFSLSIILFSGIGCNNQSSSLSGSDKVSSNEIIKGILRLDDPHGPQIGEVLIDRNYVDAHKDELQKLSEKEVEAKGTMLTHYCLPEEQCLTDGYIKSLDNILYIKTIEK